MTAVDDIAYRLRQTHAWAIAVASDLSPDELKWQLRPSTPSIGFHLWHISRWTDRTQARLAEVLSMPSPGQLWLKHMLASKWGFPTGSLGEDESGMGMDEEVSAQLPLPSPTEILGYAGHSFEALESVLAGLNPENLHNLCTDLYGRAVTIHQVLLNHLTHIDRHLGMIEAMRGAQGMKGSATV